MIAECFDVKKGLSYSNSFRSIDINQGCICPVDSTLQIWISQKESLETAPRQRFSKCGIYLLGCLGISVLCPMWLQTFLCDLQSLCLTWHFCLWLDMSSWQLGRATFHGTCNVHNTWPLHLSDLSKHILRAYTLLHQKTISAKWLKCRPPQKM